MWEYSHAAVDFGPDGIIQPATGSTLNISTGFFLFLGVQIYNVSGKYFIQVAENRSNEFS
jgi:hypothetical protein